MKQFAKVLFLATLQLCTLTCLQRIYAQTGVITTIAGNGTSGYFGDHSSATVAELQYPADVVFDVSGNLYIADRDNFYVRKVDPSGIITTIAGNGIPGNSGDGMPATSARLDGPNSLAIDPVGNLYIASNNIVRKVNTFGTISTVAGVLGSSSYNGDGHLSTATTFSPGFLYLATDGSGNVYISAQQDNRVVKFNPSAGGIVSTVAGTGAAGFTLDGVPATTSMLNHPMGITVDAAGNLYIADEVNFRIRKVNTFGLISTIAGDGTPGYTGDNGTATSAHVVSYFLSHDVSGNLYASDGHWAVRRIDGSGNIYAYSGEYSSAGYGGDNGPATNAQLYKNEGVCWNNGNLYVADAYNNRVRKIHGIDYSAPAFTKGAFTTTSVCAGDGALDVSILLSVTDTDTGFAETWSIASLPLHGAAAAYYSTTSTGAILTPSGITYTPTIGYAGADSFKVSVCDELMYDTITVRVTVSPHGACHVGISPSAEADVLRVFPNPATDELYINGLRQETGYKLCSFTGMCVLQGVLQPGSSAQAVISIEGVPKGIYVVELSGADGERKMVRVVKE